MKVAVLVPCYQGTVVWDHYTSMLKTVELGRERGIEILVFTAAACPVLPRVRNFLIAKAIAAGCEWAVFIDDDIAWAPEAFFRLIGHGVDVVAAAPAKRHRRWNEKPSTAVRFVDDRHESGSTVQIEGVMTRTGRIWKVAGLATAFMAIRLSALAKIEHLTQPYIYDGVPGDVGNNMRTWFWYKIIDAGNGDGSLTDLGEDYYFCDLIREAGGSVWVDPDIRLRHYDGNVCHDFALCDSSETTLPDLPTPDVGAVTLNSDFGSSAA